MVGPWPLAPHHDHLQYIHHVHLMKRGQIRGITSLAHQLNYMHHCHSILFELNQGEQ